jgi:hypothetical protein
LGFYFHSSLQIFGRTTTLKARRRHILWLIENHPESSIAGLSEATIDPRGQELADEEGYRQAKELWLKQADKEKDNINIKVLLNAAKFVQLHDKAIAETLLKRAQVPNHLGYLYALGILGVNMLSHTGIPTSYDPAEINGEFARKVRAELEETSDIALLVSAGTILVQYGAMMKSFCGRDFEPGASTQPGRSTVRDFDTRLSNQVGNRLLSRGNTSSCLGCFKTYGKLGAFSFWPERQFTL